MNRIHIRLAVSVAWLATIGLGGASVARLAGCKRANPGDESASVRLYYSVDEGFARAVLERFTSETGIKIAAIPDSEAGKTTGLVNRIRAEANRPHADVFWSSELFNTMLLAREGMFEPYDPPTAADVPARFKDEGRRWTATALRGRVIAFDPSRMGDTPIPTTWEQLAEADIAPHVAFANPLFGTTRGHVAAMFAAWGKERGRAFLTGLRGNGALMVDGNSAAVRAVIAGRAKIAMTDTDDVWVAQGSGAILTARYLDMGDGGTLLIPCSVALIKGGSNAAAARKLVDYLVSADVERALALSDSRNVPVREPLRRELDVTLPPATSIPFDEIADAMDESAAAVREILIR
ncbi:MAG: extracellular solute-binding protein [Planctomycetes bacterium]|nr:extracellular solute-binding protein [Planctomycetota bacterium]